jgi:hypothetical protein
MKDPVPRIPSSFPLADAVEERASIIHEVNSFQGM